MSASSSHDDYRSRANALQTWFHEILPRLPTKQSYQKFRIKLITGDASFRRYFRAYTADDSFILVDAPPQKEDSRRFVNITNLYQRAGVNIPSIFVSDINQGFMCLSDFGDILLWEKLYKAQQGERFTRPANELYQLAFDQLHLIQNIQATDNLPEFSEQLLLEECELFKHWFCKKLLGLKLIPQTENLLSETFAKLIKSAQSQPQLSVHRDYHSRNLMYLNEDKLGVIDYQDAVTGPCTYDLVSLLKDCYIAWPRQEVNDWALAYKHATKHKQFAALSDSDFMKYFDLMGAQRHLKAIGIFSRLYLRDQKINYLGDIPRTLSYLSKLKGEYAELDDFLHWLEDEVTLDIEDKILAAISDDSVDSIDSADSTEQAI